MSNKNEKIEKRPRGRPRKPVVMVEPKQRGRVSEKYVAADMDTCLDVVRQAYTDEGYVGQTVRHYYYKLLSSSALALLVDDGGSAAYGFVTRLLVKARQMGLLPYYAIVDPGRRSYQPYSHESVEEYAESAFSIGSFSFDPWSLQAYKVEVWCEKDGQMQFLQQATSTYRVPIYITKGYASYTVITDAAKRLGDGERIVVLYCGDFDPTGLDIERNVREELEKLGCKPTFKRIALTHGQLGTLPVHSALPIKRGDSRSKQFIKEFGDGQSCYELEAMPASTLLSFVQQGIAAYIESDLWQQAIDYETFINQQAKVLYDPKVMKERFLGMLRDGPLQIEPEKATPLSYDDLFGEEE